MVNIKHNMKPENISEVLTRVLDTPKLKLFHKNARIILNLIEWIPKMEMDLNIIQENSVIINERKYYCNQKTWNNFHKMIIKGIDITKEENEEISKPLNTNLNTKIQQALKKIEISKNIMYQGLYKNILQFNNFNVFIHHLVTNYIIIEQKKTGYIKRTKFDYQLGLCIVRFVIENIPGLENVFICFDKEKAITDLKQKEVKFIVKFAKTLLSNQPSSIEVKSMFEKVNINDQKLQEILYCFFDDLFYHKYKKDNIYLAELHEIMDNTKRLSHNYDLTEILIKLGDFLTSYFVKEDIFQQDFVKVDTQKTQILTSKKEIIEAIQGSNSYHKPFFIENQIVNIKLESKEDRLFNIIQENLNKFVHSNPRISIQIKNESYMKKGKTIYKKYGIYQNYLIFLLNYLCSNLNNNADFGCLAAIYEIGDFDKINDLLTNTPENTLHNIYLFLFQELKDFEQCHSANEIFDYIKNTYKYDIKHSKHRNNKELIDLIHKIFQRKLMLVTLINDAILLCIFESFIHTTFIDARGRYYLNAASTNMHTHLAAKLMIRLYDETYQKSPTKEVLTLIKNHFKFDSTKNKINNLINQNYDINYEKENRTKMLKYIESFLKPKEQQQPNKIFDVVKSLKEPLYEDSTTLLRDLSLIVKKPKRLFYVHSLLLYERERLKNKHPKHLINHYELDASSSGLQMMSGLFRSTELAKMCNLISHENTQDIYSAMTKLFITTWKSLMKFAEYCHVRYLIIINSGKLTKEETIKMKQLPEFLLQWFKLDIRRSTANITLISQIIALLPKSYFDINVDTKNMFALLDSQDKNNCQTLLKHPEFANHGYEIKGLFILRMTMRISWIITEDFKFTVDAFASDRDLFKKAIMTYFYKSTTHGRKQDYIDYFNTRFPVTSTYEMKTKLNTLINFLDRFFIKALQQMPDVDLMNQLIATMDLTKPVTISNKNFLIYIEPKIQIRKQIQCPNIGGKRGLQLTILKVTNQIDKIKMKSMLGANIVHSMDAHVVHLLNELILTINNDLKHNKFNFKLVHDTNHDCFHLSCPFLLQILIEECYLICFQEDYLNCILGISDEVKNNLQKLSVEDFLKALTPINDLFIK